jgi:mRNA-degrading endonuclease toxin of MazEF toxin-antitoxin module
MTTIPAEAPLFRVPIAPNERNGLNSLSRLMVDKITTVPKNKLGHRIAHLDVKDIECVDQAILIFLGFGRLADQLRNARAMVAQLYRPFVGHSK